MNLKSFHILMVVVLLMLLGMTPTARSDVLSAKGNQLWSQNSPKIEDDSEQSDHFGTALAAGDFDDDKYCDLAIGVPGEEIINMFGAGAVNILYGSPTGLSGERNQFLSQADFKGGPVSSVRFGAALAAGDFNNDKCYDLAIGVPEEEIANIDDAGAVNILYGKKNTGLSPICNQIWSQYSSDMKRGSEQSDRFGAALAAGDFNNDKCYDLAIGIRYEDIGKIAWAGAVNILYGPSPPVQLEKKPWWKTWWERFKGKFKKR